MRVQRRHFLTTVFYVSIGLFIGSFFGGCAPKSAKTTNNMVNIPGFNINESFSGNESVDVYGILIQKEQDRTTKDETRIKKFIIQSLSGGNVEIIDGTPYLLNAKEFHQSLKPQLSALLKKGYDVTTINELTVKYASSTPIIPGSSFCALPYGKGSDLHSLAEQSYAKYKDGLEDMENRLEYLRKRSK